MDCGYVVAEKLRWSNDLQRYSTCSTSSWHRQQGGQVRRQTHAKSTHTKETQKIVYLPRQGSLYRGPDERLVTGTPTRTINVGKLYGPTHCEFHNGNQCNAQVGQQSGEQHGVVGSRSIGTVTSPWQLGGKGSPFMKMGGHKRVCANYQGITLLSFLRKTYAGLLERRLWLIMEPQIKEEQCRFYPAH